MKVAVSIDHVEFGSDTGNWKLKSFSSNYSTSEDGLIEELKIKKETQRH